MTIRQTYLFKFIQKPENRLTGSRNFFCNITQQQFFSTRRQQLGKECKSKDVPKTSIYVLYLI